MTRWLPSPLLSLALLVIWLLLNQTLYLGHILLGVVLAVAAPLLSRPIMPFTARLRKPVTVIKLVFAVLVDIIKSCMNVSRIILLTKRDKVNSQFIRIPLDLRDPTGLAVLSCIVNSTPGTVWIEILPEKHELYLHVFDLHDEAWWAATIKNRYEQPLIDIFEAKQL